MANLAIMDVIVQALGDASNINIEDQMGHSPLHFVASDLQNKDKIATLLTLLRGTYESVDEYIIPLWRAFQSSDFRLDVINLFLDSGALIDHKNDEGMSALHFAVVDCLLDVIKLLIDRGANINSRNYNDRTPLHCTSWKCKRDVIQLLLESGADINTMSICGLGPQTSSEFSILTGIDIERTVNTGESPLYSVICSSCCNLDVVKLLLDFGADVNLGTKFGESPLVAAIKSCNCPFSVIELLLDRGANINVKFQPDFFSFLRVIEIDYMKMLHPGRPLECVKLVVKYTMLEHPDFNFFHDFESWGGVESLSMFSVWCEKEIYKMDLEYIAQNVTLLDFLNVSRLMLCGKASPSICKEMEGIECDINKILKILFDNTCPVYSKMISSILKRSALISSLEGQPMFTLEKGTNQACIDIKKVYLDYNSVINLAKYLSFDDLLNLILAFFGSSDYIVNMSDPRTSSQQEKKYRLGVKRPLQVVKRITSSIPVEYPYG